MDVIKMIESRAEKQDIPAFNPGDTVKVHQRVVEGDKQRIQVFEGVVIARRGSRTNASFTVRKVSYGIGVERIFPLHSPNVIDVKALRSGKTRRAKLYYLRKRKGKSVRLAHRHSKHTVAR